MNDSMEKELPKLNGPIITLKKLLEAGAHFGHQTKRWNPKMRRYIYTARGGIYIFDLDKTAKCIEEAYKELKEITEKSGKMLFIGTKKQVREAVKEEALRSGSFYVNYRWLGGILTNFKTIQKRIKRLKDLENMSEDTLLLLPKKEVAQLKKEQEKLEKYFSGVKEMRKLPNAIFVIDPRIEHNAIKEARKLGIPIFGIVDTNCDPDEVDFIIPSNDDALRAVKLILSTMADAIVEVKGGQTISAYVGDENSDVSMNDAIKDVDLHNQERAAMLQKRKEREYNRREKSRPYDRDNNDNRDHRDNRDNKTGEKTVEVTTEPIEKK